MAIATPALDFYMGTGVDHKGRTIDTIWSFSEDELEGEHDYIQWLFPLHEASRFNQNAPLLEPLDLIVFNRSISLRGKLRNSFRIMLGFYGYQLSVEKGVIGVTPSRNFPEYIQYWVRENDHNYLRITRILRSLALLGLPKEARAFLGALEELYSTHGDIIGENTLRFWQEAVVVQENAETQFSWMR